jgi:hypothetical protein
MSPDESRGAFRPPFVLFDCAAWSAGGGIGAGAGDGSPGGAEWPTTVRAGRMRQASIRWTIPACGQLNQGAAAVALPRAGPSISLANRSIGLHSINSTIEILLSTN